MSATNPIEFLKDALYVHTRQVENYCRSELRRVQSAIQTENVRASESTRGQRLVKQLEDLIKTARGSECLKRAVNLEQLEARTDRLLHLLNDENEVSLSA
ncbi:hypothetical protein FACS1894139_06360 [Planctomycetales bacterium]|nr:hypothetical protein FACS1894107_08150 [Planctomycetales bacterium]GHS96095.1 hypothetical protein FACS1894108_00080 [Planctomycetales bacterium]GHT04352.1 hypothetical protein FACS1894139_06360 [Planctomycetales bacterium]GHV23662.1 hypothetical protein AGMMS49959_17450 [Planctomycetales bacterium]